MIKVLFKIIPVVLILSLGAYLCVRGVSALNFQPSPKKFLIVGSGSISGVYYRTAGQLCSIINASGNLSNILNESGQVAGVDCSVQSTAGSLYNINALKSGNADIVMTQGDLIYKAYNGLSPFSQPFKGLRLLASTYKEPLTILARKDAKIRVINDLLGKRINIGAPGTGVSEAISLIMSTKGWHRSDFKITTRLRDSEQAQALCDNKIDAMIVVVGHPSGAVQEAMATCDVNFVHLDSELIASLTATYPYYTPFSITKEAYSLQEDIKTIAVDMNIAVLDSMPDELVSQIAQLLMDNFSTIKAVHPALRGLEPLDIVRSGFAPLHNGAENYYKKIGLMK